MSKFHITFIPKGCIPGNNSQMNFRDSWIPASAGVTKKGGNDKNSIYNVIPAEAGIQ
jgi:hypothetical protein